jgi:hypothetical protein
MKNILIVINGLILILLSSTWSYAACTWNGNIGTAASLDHADITACINDIDSSKSGEIIIEVPSGSAEWDDKVTINMSDTSNPAPNFTNVSKLKILGAGIDQTTITGDVDKFRITGLLGKAFRITGFTLDISSTLGDGVLQIYIVGTSQTWRIDHCKIIGGSQGVFTQTYTYGVVDHCQINSYGTGHGYQEGVHVRDGLGVGSNQAWSRGLALGTANAVYVEDCIFYSPDANGGGALDGDAGARIVFRNNTLTNRYIGIHDAIINGNRGTFSWEIYNNTFNWTVTPWRIIGLRGGTGVVYNNTFNATSISSGNAIGLTNYRSCILDNSGAGDNCWGPLCNGSYETANGKTKLCMEGSTTSVRECDTDADCGGVAGSCRAPDATGGTGYMCADQIGTTTGGVSEPAYFWNNIWTQNSTQTGPVVYDAGNERSGCITNSSLPFVGGECSSVGGCFTATNHIVLNRDYYLSEKPSYIPYTYPHPLTKIKPVQHFRFADQ